MPEFSFSMNVKLDTVACFTNTRKLRQEKVDQICVRFYFSLEFLVRITCERIYLHFSKLIRFFLYHAKTDDIKRVVLSHDVNVCVDKMHDSRHGFSCLPGQM